MSKRSPGHEQRPHGFWPTPREAVAPLVRYLPPRATYGEPCAGDLSMVKALSSLWPNGACTIASDIVVRVTGVDQIDAMTLGPQHAPQMWITNPPWPKGGKRGDPALSIIRHLAQLAPVWALLPWDFAANDYFRHVAPWCSEIVPIGRVSWLCNGTPGKDNCAWYRFDANNRHQTIVHARRAAA